MTPLYGQAYPPDRMLPLRVELRNTGASSVDGVVVIAVAQPPAAANYHVPVLVPPRTRVALTAYAPLPTKPLPSAASAAATGTGVAAVAVAEWRRADGTRLSRAEILGRPDASAEAQADGSPVGRTRMLLSVTGRERESAGEEFLVEGLGKLLGAHASHPIIVGAAEPQDLPRHRAGYDGVAAVVWDAVAPESLDLSQRQALLDHILSGGTLVLPAPLDDADPAGTWIEPYVPVQVIGRREADQIAANETSAVAGGTAAGPLKLRGPTRLSEALDSRGEVRLRDAAYVHAAVRRVGVGRVVFTSFPANALDPSDARAEALWRALLGLDRPATDWTLSAGRERDELLETMIGAPAAPWAHAAAVAGGYVALLLFVHLVWRGARQPAAFGVATALGVVLCGAMLGLTSQRTRAGGVSAARLGVVELGATGGGIRQEAWAFLGKDDSGLALTVDLPAVLRPAVTTVEDPPIVTQLPLATSAAGVHAGRLDRVWQASAAVAAEQAVRAMAQFTPDGVKIDIENHIGEDVVAPLLVWNGNGYRLPPVPSGTLTAMLGPKNPPGDFTNVAVFTGEEAMARGQMVRSIQAAGDGVAASASLGPALIGWLNPAGPGLGAPIVRCSTEPQPTRAHVLLRAPVEIRPSPPGSTIKIPPDLVALIGGADAGVFYDAAQREWLRSLQTGAWTLGFRPPAGIGKVKPLRAVISADISAPGHTIVLRRGQFGGGALADNPDGPAAAEWANVVGTRTATVELDEGDVGADGSLWLRMSVEVTDFGAGGAIPQWKFNDLSVGLELQVTDAADPQGKP